MSAAARSRSDPQDLPGEAHDLDTRLVWIWGSPRSGSTWLLQQLCHPLEPDVRAPAGFRPAPQRSDAGPFDAVPVDESFIPNHLAPAFGDPIDVEGAYVPATLNNYLGRNPSYAFSEQYADWWRPQFRRLALLRLQSIVERARQEGIPIGHSPLIVIKEVNGSHASDLTMSLFDRSRMLFLVRDGRDVVDSLLAAYAPGGFLARNQGRAFETPDERLEGVRWASLLWSCNVDVTLKAHDAHPPELRRIVRYEDLLADPIGTLAPLFEWLGLERSEQWVEEMAEAHSFAALPAGRRGPGRRQRAASPGRWRESLTPDEQRTAVELIGPRLERLGYER